jgi:hypothetical protein
LALVLSSVVAVAWFARAQTPTTAPTTPLTATPLVATPPAPLLDQINHETQNLFESVRSGLVVVKLPPPQLPDPFNDTSGFMQKWSARLSPDVLAKLHEAQARAASGGISTVGAFVAASQPAELQSPTSQTTSQTTSQPANQDANPGSRSFFVRRPDGETELVTTSTPIYDAILDQMAPRCLGLVLDDARHVLIPIFIDKEALAGQPLHVFDARGKLVAAQFIGSDRQMNLTVVQLETPIGKPLHITGDRPPDGSLVMLLSPSGDSGHLSIWTNGTQDRGLLITTSGAIGGIVRSGEFASGNSIKPIADQLIQYGKVRRAALGVAIRQTETPNGHPAMLIEHVVDHSAAAEGGLRDGDFIVSLAGVPVADVFTFAAAIAQGNGPTDLQIVRDGQVGTVTVNLKPQ